MKLNRVDRADTSMIYVEGKLTATKLDESLRGLVKEILASGLNQIIINMDLVDHMDSTGVGELVSAYTAVAKEKGNLSLCKIQSDVLELLHTTNLLEVFTVLEEDAPEVQAFIS